jgi:multiple sugar transport system permease protein
MTTSTPTRKSAVASKSLSTATGRRTGLTMAARERRRKILAYALLVVVTAFFVAPIAYMVIGSFKPSAQVLDGLAGFLPTDMSLDNYAGVIGRFDGPESGYFWNFYLTSAIVSFFIVAGGLVVNSMIAYALARLRWRGRNTVLTLIVILVILPFEAIFLFYTFFIGLPGEIQESARLDGAGPWRTFFAIIVPMSKPVFASVTILSFLAAWSSFLFPVMMVDQPQYRPLPLAIAVFKAQPPTDWGQIFAFGVLLVIPVVVVFLLFQRFFIQSVASSAVKG